MFEIKHIEFGKNALNDEKTQKILHEISIVFNARLLTPPFPHDGDAVILKGKNGVTYESGHLESRDKNQFYFCISFCTEPMRPNIATIVNTEIESIVTKPYTITASGGYWGKIKDISKLKHIDVVDKTFWFWGSYTSKTDDGRIYITIPVNRWEYTDLEGNIL